MDDIDEEIRAALLEASNAFFSQREAQLASLEGPVRSAWVSEWVRAPLEEASVLEARLGATPEVAEVMELLKVLWRATFGGVRCAPGDERLPMIGFPIPGQPAAPTPTPAPRRKAPARPAPPPRRRGPAPKKPAPRGPRRRPKR